MDRAPSTARLLVVYAALSAVYLLYLPHALPVLDDWIHLEWFERARTGGAGAQLDFLRRLIDNTWIGGFRVFWTSFIPTFLLSFAAGFTAWPYNLLAWIAHVTTAVLFAKTVSLLAGDPECGFATGAVYVVFPAANNPLFWPVSTCFYYLAPLGLTWWFHRSWTKLAVREDYRHGWKEWAILVAVVFSGQQVLPALVALLPVTHWLWGRREQRQGLLRFWALHATAVVALLALYAFCINRVPVAHGFQERYGGSGYGNLWAFAWRLMASLGLRPDLAEWRPQWRLDLPLAALLVLAAGAFLWNSRRLGGSRAPAATQARLLLWSLSGALLSYLPAALLREIEWRYLYLPALFLVSAGVAVFGLLPGRARQVLAFLAVAYGVMLSYFEIRQCWVPQSREARAILNAVAGAGPVSAGEVFIFSRAPYSMGPAPSFIAGAGWSLEAVVEHYTGAEQVQAAREVLVNEQGEMALYNRDKLSPFSRRDLPRLRVFVRDENGRFVPKSLLALPTAGGRFELAPLRPLAGRQAPAGSFTLEELKGLPLYNELYFAHPHTGPLPHA